MFFSSHVVSLFLVLCNGSGCKQHQLQPPEEQAFASVKDCQSRSMPMLASWYTSPENQLLTNGRSITRFWCMTQGQYQKQARFF